jgi:hypothetical protein
LRAVSREPGRKVRLNPRWKGRVTKRQPRPDRLEPDRIALIANPSPTVSKPYVPVTDAELVRARTDPDFRQQLLSQNLDALLAGLQKLRNGSSSAPGDSVAGQIREGVELAVKLAELIQAPGNPQALRPGLG